MSHNDKLDVMLVASVGGHLDQLIRLADAYEGLKYRFIVNDSHSSHPVIGNHYSRIYHAERNLAQLINLWQAFCLVFRFRPKVILSTGAAPAVPFAIVGRLLGAKIIFLESYSRVTKLSLTGKIMLYLSHIFLVQWEDLLESHPKALFKGRVE